MEKHAYANTRTQTQTIHAHSQTHLCTRLNTQAYMQTFTHREKTPKQTLTRPRSTQILIICMSQNWDTWQKKIRKRNKPALLAKISSSSSSNKPCTGFCFAETVDAVRGNGC